MVQKCLEKSKNTTINQKNITILKAPKKERKRTNVPKGA